MAIPNTIKSRQLKGDIMVLGPLAAGGLFIAYQALPYINNMLGMMQTMLMRGIAVTAMLTVLGIVGSNYERLLRLGRVASRALIRQFVAIDPIGFMEEIYADVQDRLRMIAEKAAVIKSVVEGVLAERKELKRAIRLAKERAQVVEDVNQAQMLGRDLERKENSLRDIEEKLEKISRLDKALGKAREICMLKAGDLTSQLEEAKRQQRINKQTAGLIADLRAVMNPGNDEVQWNDALMEIESTWGETRAEMDIFMDDLGPMLANKEIDDAIAVNRIEELRKKAGPLKVRIDPSAAGNLTEDEEDSFIGVDTSRISMRRQ